MPLLGKVNWKRKNGAIWIAPEIRGEARVRVLRKEKEYAKLRRKGVPWKEAEKLSSKVEHRGLTQHQISVYEGKLSGIARRRK